MNTTRRAFLILSATTSGSAIAATAVVVANPSASSAEMVVNEKDPVAVALGYMADTTKVDQKKFPKHTNEQKCSGCMMYQGKAADPMAPCAIFSGKKVMAKGWCSAYSKKV